jgi:hypothetical protein
MKILISIIIIAGIIGGIIFIMQKNDDTAFVSEQKQEWVYSFDNEYRDSNGLLAFRYPKEFSVRTVDAPNELGENVHTILIETDDLKQGVQVVMTPYDGEKPITEELITRELPGLLISETQILEIGNNNSGLAFKSDNQAFDGASREVWFEYKGYLFQISTYDSNDAFLQSFFTTWQLL